MAESRRYWITIALLWIATAFFVGIQVGRYLQGIE